MISRKENLIICDCAQFILDTIVANFSKLKPARSTNQRRPGFQLTYVSKILMLPKTLAHDPALTVNLLAKIIAM